jgi:hypothetical protein
MYKTKALLRLFDNGCLFFVESTIEIASCKIRFVLNLTRN